MLQLKVKSEKKITFGMINGNPCHEFLAKGSVGITLYVKLQTSSYSNNSTQNYVLLAPGHIPLKYHPNKRALSWV